MSTLVDVSAITDAATAGDVPVTTNSAAPASVGATPSIRRSTTALRRASPLRLCLSLFLLSLLCFAAWTVFTLRALRAPDELAPQRLVEYFDPQFGAALGRLPIEEVHELGLHHRGVMVFLLRSPHGAQSAPAGGDHGAPANNGLEVLLLRRGAAARECAGAWGILVEHANAGEPYFRTALRGLREEVGLFAQEREIVAIQRCTLEHPVEGGKPNTEGNHDRQLTYVTAYQADQRQHIDLDSAESVSLGARL